MISLISNAAQTDLAAASAAETGSATPTKASNSSQSEPTASVPVDTVHISSAATAVMQEAIETPAQTAREASSGDHQAQTLLAKERAVR